MINNLISFGEQISEILMFLIAIVLIFVFSLMINKPGKKYLNGGRFKSN